MKRVAGVDPGSCSCASRFPPALPPRGDPAAPLRRRAPTARAARGGLPRVREGPREEDRRARVGHRRSRAGGHDVARLLSGVRQDGGELRAGPDARLPDHAAGPGRDVRVPHEPRRTASASAASRWSRPTPTPRDTVARRLRTRPRSSRSLTPVAPAPPARCADARAGAGGSGAGRDATSASYTLSPEQREKAVAYSRAQYRLHFIGFAWEVARPRSRSSPSRVAPRFRDLAERVSRRRFVQALVFVPLLLLIVWRSSDAADRRSRPPPLARLRPVGAGLGIVVLGLGEGASRGLAIAVPSSGALRDPREEPAPVVVLLLAGVAAGDRLRRLHRARSSSTRSSSASSRSSGRRPTS